MERAAVGVMGAVISCRSRKDHDPAKQAGIELMIPGRCLVVHPRRVSVSFGGNLSCSGHPD
jgi:hypothetical protein